MQPKFNSKWRLCNIFVSQHALRQTPPRAQTDSCRNITFTTSLRPVTNYEPDRNEYSSCRVLKHSPESNLSLKKKIFAPKSPCRKSTQLRLYICTILSKASLKILSQIAIVRLCTDQSELSALPSLNTPPNPS